MRAAWQALGLELLPSDEGHAAHTLSAVRYPDGIGPELVGEIGKEGGVVAGGLYPGLQGAYFRVGHMGEVTRSDTSLRRTVEAIARGLDLDPRPGLDAFG